MIDPEMLVSAYASGWFPMAVEHGEIRWFSPDPRGILPLQEFRVPPRLARTWRRGRFEIAVDRAFREVVESCATVPRDRDDPGTWITQEIVESYDVLHVQGVAHSVEAWREGRLAGGLYGVALGGAFFGESMFHRETDASKIALIALVERLRARGYSLLDTQWSTAHLAQFGVVDVPRRQYLRLLDRALRLRCDFV
jgi:leucyl/phenylalanyl-tRNA--protein transferase